MVKYVDAGYEEPSFGGKKKRNKKGFKVDRRANYEKMIARKFTGKDDKKTPEKRPTRVKSLVFDDDARKEYLLTLHKKKNERRVQAFVDVKRKMRKDNARTRQQQREDARKAYNSYARVPILPNYTFQLPNYEQHFADDSDEEAEEEDHDDDDEGSDAASSNDPHSDSDEEEEEEDEAEEGATPWVYMGGGDGEDEEEGDEEERLRQLLKEKKLQRKMATKARSRHVMPSAMTGADDEAGAEAAGGRARRRSAIEDDSVTVEVKPLFGSRAALVAGSGAKTVSTLPSQNFSDLPAVVEQELRRLRQETKGPARTKAKVHMMKELEKIRKIKKYSRKGYGKRTSSGKRKNRQK